MKTNAQLAHFLLLGQTAERVMQKVPDVVPRSALLLREGYDLAELMPDIVSQANLAAEIYRLFFAFENYLREFIVQVLSKDGTEDWYSKVPTDITTEVSKLEENEESKTWMALGSRDKSSLLTFPQLVRIIDHCWKDGFSDLLRDKALIGQARVISHLRNAICHMTAIPKEEEDRVKQVMRDWFRIIPP